MRLAVLPGVQAQGAAEGLDAADGAAGGAAETMASTLGMSTPSAISPGGRPSRYQVGTMPVCHH